MLRCVIPAVCSRFLCGLPHEESGVSVSGLTIIIIITTIIFVLVSILTINNLRHVVANRALPVTVKYGLQLLVPPSLIKWMHLLIRHAYRVVAIVATSCN